MTVSINTDSGFCFGVTSAIRKAEEELGKEDLFCLGDIVHNSQEVKRLERLGLETIDYDDLRTLHHVRVLLRAHGEPPSTYHIAKNNDIEIIDATCPVVKKLQERIRNTYHAHRDAQVVIYGKEGHAEVIGLQGQTNNTAIIIESLQDIDKLDFQRDIYLFSQTTKSVDGFQELVKAIQEQIANIKTLYPTQKHPYFEYHDTICRSVANRLNKIREFAAEQDLVFFVGGRKSSNAKVLFEYCREANKNTIFVENAKEVSKMFPLHGEKIGICGATSTPQWLMQEVADVIKNEAL